MADLIKPEEVTITTMDEEDITFVISRLPATAAREVVTQYPITAVPAKMGGDYARNEELMLKMLKYAGIAGKGANGQPLMLVTRALIDSHIPDFETLVKLEMAMLEKNCSFFSKGGLSNFLERMAGKVQVLITQTLTDLLRPSSKKG